MPNQNSFSSSAQYPIAMSKHIIFLSSPILCALSLKKITKDYLRKNENNINTISDMISFTKGSLHNFKFHVFVNLYIILVVYNDSIMYEKKIIPHFKGDKNPTRNLVTAGLDIISIVGLTTTLAYNLVYDKTWQDKLHFVAAFTFFTSSCILNFLTDYCDSIKRPEKRKIFDDDGYLKSESIEYEETYKIVNRTSNIICVGSLAVILTSYLLQKVFKDPRRQNLFRKSFSYAEFSFLLSVLMFRTNRYILHRFFIHNYEKTSFARKVIEDYEKRKK